MGAVKIVILKDLQKQDMVRASFLEKGSMAVYERSIMMGAT